MGVAGGDTGSGTEGLLERSLSGTFLRRQDLRAVYGVTRRTILGIFGDVFGQGELKMDDTQRWSLIHDI